MTIWSLLGFALLLMLLLAVLGRYFQPVLRSSSKI